MKTNGMSGEDCATVIKLTDDAGVPAEGATAQPTPRWPLVNLRLLRRHFKEAETENPKEQHKGSILTTSEEKDLVAILQKAHALPHWLSIGRSRRCSCSNRRKTSRRNVLRTQ
jgi:hypothetical protein